MQLFYHQNISQTDSMITFSKEESRHIVKVLRKNIGDILMVTNGNGFLFTTEILSISPQRCVAKINTVKEEPAPPYHLHLLVAPTKMNDRYEWFLEKATEIGIQEITPVFCGNSERRAIKRERLEKVLQSAMKQSLQTRIPLLQEAAGFREIITQDTRSTKLIAHCEEGKERKALKTIIQPGKKYCILIGPEGDFTSDEIDLAIKNGWQPVSLGNNRLRTETAAIVACHTVALANEI